LSLDDVSLSLAEHAAVEATHAARSSTRIDERGFAMPTA
jgi:hypothetical protein